MYDARKMDLHGIKKQIKNEEYYGIIFAFMLCTLRCLQKSHHRIKFPFDS